LERCIRVAYAGGIMRTRKVLLASTYLAAALAAPPALAQGKPAPPSGPSRSSAQFTLRREEAGGGDANVARQRARAGDCAGALPAFDAAVRVTIEPTLRRDRGLCHEQLGHPFPAIADYREYLTARPDAPDADQVRDRLARLEEQVGIGGPSSQQVRDRDNDSGYAASASFSAGSGGASASSSSSSRRGSATLGPRAGEQERSYDYYAARERAAEAAEESPLRHGTGWVLGPFLYMPRYVSGAGQADLFFGTGLTVRYSFTSRWTFVSELGYAGVLERGASAGGILTFAGFEGRVPLDGFASNQLYLGFGAGYERLSSGESDVALNFILGRGRFGYRHVFGPSVAIELGVDGGPALVVPSGGGDSEVRAVIGGAFAFVVGF